MKFPKILYLIALTSFLLAACTPAKEAKIYTKKDLTSTNCISSNPNKTETCQITNPTIPAPINTPEIVPTVYPSGDQAQTDQLISENTRTDNQGAVVVDIKPLNLDQPGDTLIFDVSMNTHSVDLNMDLVPLTTLTTDTGVTVPALKWDGPSGGHHVEGQLSFPETSDGKNLLDGVSSITITIMDVDAAARTFTWQLHS